MRYDDRTEWLWWAGPGHTGGLTRANIGTRVKHNGRFAVVADVTPNAVLVEWENTPPDGGPVEMPWKAPPK